MKPLHPVGISRIAVSRRPGARHLGILRAGGLSIPVALGRSGIAADKREGDGRTPAGRWRILALLYRPDHGPRPVSRLPARTIRPDDGWCDDRADRRYNHPVTLPIGGPRKVSHEKMWRDDTLYDLVLVIDHNQRPRIAGRGSAVFVHLARPGFKPTEGCVALRRADMKRLLARLRPGAVIDIV
ncbi:L,D-peptidoglycan transpeptidase YkuD (ErfK/YbiS/YcfS/YnhG family) [Xanthobacter flavus]|uniref:L,D-peptidoglycan transpeptidase YkuD (ErfK/YbiS/YcfS/YnhG family) n=1 Tax=Xanthobacter flavus TaxID=281 RepID=A0ABU1KF05_XANFL|nr:L,D-transpeptidase family protein [Xanthobacter flavus]MDR6333410.1 L,D-peptidoglycan transpeptidase YkuD (ErfK/YbiS/YcfS/YnhG family) [Xanthobacter flavus]